MPRKYEPLGSRVLIEPVRVQETTKSGLVLPDVAKEIPQEGKVIAVGPGKYNDEGKRVAVQVKVGERVLFARFTGTQFKDDGRDFFLIEDEALLAKFG